MSECAPLRVYLRAPPRLCLTAGLPRIARLGTKSRSDCVSLSVWRWRGGGAAHQSWNPWPALAVPRRGRLIHFHRPPPVYFICDYLCKTKRRENNAAAHDWRCRGRRRSCPPPYGPTWWRAAAINDVRHGSAMDDGVSVRPFPRATRICEIHGIMAPHTASCTTDPAGSSPCERRKVFCSGVSSTGSEPSRCARRPFAP